MKSLRNSNQIHGDPLSLISAISKNAAFQHESECKNTIKHSIQIDDGSFDEISEETKKELIDFTDKYVVDNVTKKVIVEKKKTEAIVTIASTQMKVKYGSFEINEKITKELDVTFTSSNDLITSAQIITINDELKSVDPSKELLDASDKYTGKFEDLDETEDSDETEMK
ncbi:hypothetical protein Glove_213g124 [Diversispora epigaea]|uniref:Uncharacterized protein n=1 Tax=Diversispora epigaea TaxID=1348612 RepID=A0A397IKS1_9GLOM|nr:hypothetical protein Glove_213g124 [Diversispora epigaea]